MTSRTQRFVGAFFLVLALAWLSWMRGFFSSGSSQSAVTHDILHVGTNVGYPPFIMTDEYGNPIGFDYAVASEIARRLGKKLELHDMSFGALVIALQKKKVAMIIGGISLTPAKKASGLFLPYYGDVVKKVAVFAKRDTPQVSSLSQLSQKGLRVCTQAGTTFSEVLEKDANLSLRILPNISDLVLEVLYGRSDIGILDPDSVRSLVSRNDAFVMYEVALDPRDYIDGFGIGVQDDDEREQIGKILDQMKEDGTLQRLQTQWFSSY